MSDPTDVTLAGLQATIDALACLERSMYHLHRERAKYHPKLYEAMAEGTVEEILKLRAEIDAAIGLTAFAPSPEMYNPLPPKPELPPLGTPPTANGGSRAATSDAVGQA